MQATAGHVHPRTISLSKKLLGSDPSEALPGTFLPSETHSRTFFALGSPLPRAKRPRMGFGSGLGPTPEGKNVLRSTSEVSLPRSFSDEEMVRDAHAACPGCGYRKDALQSNSRRMQFEGHALDTTYLQITSPCGLIQTQRTRGIPRDTICRENYPAQFAFQRPLN